MSTSFTNLKKLLKKVKKFDLAPRDPALYRDYVTLLLRIDHILYTEWDPIGVQTIDDEFDCRDEYHDYVLEITEMVQAGASVQEVSDRLFTFEKGMKGGYGGEIRRRCDVIAAMVTDHGPHAAALIKPPVVSAHSEDQARQSVLDLLTKTRLDSYRGRWDAVCAGYQQIIALCRIALPHDRALHGFCLNNLGVAYSHAGQLEKAREAYELALPYLEHDPEFSEREATNYYAQNPSFPLDVCLSNLINQLAYCGRHVETLPYHAQRIAAMIQRWSDDDDDDDLRRARQQMQTATSANPPPVKLAPRRLSTYGDGQGRIGQVIFIE